MSSGWGFTRQPAPCFHLEKLQLFWRHSFLSCDAESRVSFLSLLVSPSSTPVSMSGSPPVLPSQLPPRRSPLVPMLSHPLPNLNAIIHVPLTPVTQLLAPSTVPVQNPKHQASPSLGSDPKPAALGGRTIESPLHLAPNASPKRCFIN